MALWVCSGEVGCGTKYAVGLFRCPRCHNREFYEDGDMAKITRHGGASDKTLPVPEQEPEAADAETAPVPSSIIQTDEVLSEEDVAALRAEHEGGEEPSPGSSSPASTEKPPTSSELSSKPTRKRARTTASRSGPARTESSSASGTAGGPEADTSAADSSGK